MSQKLQDDFIEKYGVNNYREGEFPNWKFQYNVYDETALIFFKKMLMSKFFLDESEHQFFKLYLAVFGECKSRWRELVGSTRIINWKYWAEQFPDPDLIRIVIKRNEFLI